MFTAAASQRIPHHALTAERQEKGERYSMGKHFFDYDDGDFAYAISDRMAIDSDGDLLMRMDDHTAMDMDSRELHMISDWSREEEK